MAISKDIWLSARAMFEGGASLNDIYVKTRIERSTVSKKAKKEEWVKGKNSQIISNEINSIVDKSTLSQQELNYHNDEVEKAIAFSERLDTFSVKVMDKAETLIDASEGGVDFKAIVDGVDKHSVTMKFNQRHASGSSISIDNTNAQQAVSKTLDDFYGR